MEKIISEYGITFPIGITFFLIGFFWIIIRLFRTNILWGIVFFASVAPLKLALRAANENSSSPEFNPIFLAPILVLLVFFVRHWRLSWKPFLMAALGFALIAYSLGTK
jgi:hypothetical protein